MEVSSEAYFRKRLETIDYDISVITNVTSEHLNIHGSFENYVECKLQLFKQTKKDGYSILNHDDEYFDKVKEYFKNTEMEGKILEFNQWLFHRLLFLTPLRCRPRRTGCCCGRYGRPAASAGGCR